MIAAIGSLGLTVCLWALPAQVSSNDPPQATLSRTTIHLSMPEKRPTARTGTTPPKSSEPSSTLTPAPRRLPRPVSGRDSAG